jgi:uncharacterized membrane protein YGL010W
VVYATLYVLMEPVAGGLYAPVLLGGAAYANHLVATHGSSANHMAIGVHILAWVAQALFQAPFFVWLEVLFMFGYRPELKARLDSAIQKDVKKFRDDAAAEKANGHSNMDGSTNGLTK